MSDTAKHQHHVSRPKRAVQLPLRKVILRSSEKKAAGLCGDVQLRPLHQLPFALLDAGLLFERRFSRTPYSPVTMLSLNSSIGSGTNEGCIF